MPLSVTLQCVALSVLGGALFGLNTAYVPALLAWDASLRNCSAYRSEAVCAAVSARAGCRWWPRNDSQAAGECRFSDFPRVDCANLSRSEQACAGASGTSESDAEAFSATAPVCVYDSSAKLCRHGVSQWSPLLVGVIASALIVGGAAGSLGGAHLADSLGRRRALLVVVAVGVAAVAVEAVGWQLDVDAALIAARVLMGAAVGCVAVIVPMHVGEHSPPSIANTTLVAFQVAVTTSAFLVAVVLFAMRVDYATLAPAAAATLVARFHVMHALCAADLLALGLVLTLGMREEDSAAAAGEGALLARCNADVEAEADASAVVAPSVDAAADGNGDTREATASWPLWRVVALSVTLAAILQLTGVNALINFSGTLIVSSMGFAADVGTLIVFSVFFVTTLLAFPATRLFRPRPTYLVSTGAVGASCLVMALAVMPAFGLSHSAALGLGATGLVIYSIFFHAGCGPLFFLLAQGSFPPSQRALGCSVANASQFAFNVLVNLLFPVAVAAASGGPAADQQRGLAVLFFFFGAAGFFAAAAFSWLAPRDAGDASRAVLAAH
jgi:hypothetical protein